eukprot:10164203-Lingulodinium_polyedra.AAC.1
MDRGDARVTYDIVKQLLPYKAKKAPAVKLADGKMAPSPAAVVTRWCEHFQGQLHGAFTDFAQLQARALEGSSHACQSMKSHELTMQLVPP